MPSYIITINYQMLPLYMIIVCHHDVFSLCMIFIYYHHELSSYMIILPPYVIITYYYSKPN